MATTTPRVSDWLGKPFACFGVAQPRSASSFPARAFPGDLGGPARRRIDCDSQTRGRLMPLIIEYPPISFFQIPSYHVAFANLQALTRVL